RTFRCIKIVPFGLPCYVMLLPSVALSDKTRGAHTCLAPTRSPSVQSSQICTSANPFTWPSWLPPFPNNRWAPGPFLLVVGKPINPGSKLMEFTPGRCIKTMSQQSDVG
ncbi:hypothetical protein F5Y13DRAFT_153047, partial [Hypoxylon sp. FL1857]